MLDPPVVVNGSKRERRKEDRHPSAPFLSTLLLSLGTSKLVLDLSMSNCSRVIRCSCKACPHHNRKRMKAVSATTLSTELHSSIPM